MTPLLFLFNILLSAVALRVAVQWVLKYTIPLPLALFISILISIVESPLSYFAEFIFDQITGFSRFPFYLLFLIVVIFMEAWIYSYFLKSPSEGPIPQRTARWIAVVQILVLNAFGIAINLLFNEAQRIHS